MNVPMSGPRPRFRLYPFIFRQWIGNGLESYWPRALAWAHSKLAELIASKTKQVEDKSTVSDSSLSQSCWGCENILQSLSIPEAKACTSKLYEA
jgi:hypothetical protein